MCKSGQMNSSKHSEVRTSTTLADVLPKHLSGAGCAVAVPVLEHWGPPMETSPAPLAIAIARCALGAQKENNRTTCV